MTDAAAPIVLGTMHFGTRTAREDAFKILDAYVDHGGSWIDTANAYAFWSSETGFGGQSEEVIGEWITARRNRGDVRLSSKVGVEPLVPGGYPDHVEGLGFDAVQAAMHASLRRLKVEHLDMYWAHKEDRTQSIAAVTETFGGLVTEGLTARIGLSNHPAWYLAAANAHAAHGGSPGFSATQLRESYLHPRPDLPVDGQDHPNGMMTPETKDYAAYAGVDLWAYTPLLTGAYEHPDRALPSAYDHPGTTARRAALVKVAAELGVKPSQLVIAWLLAQTPRVIPIIGVSSPAQIIEALQASHLEVPQDLMRDLNIG
ncbi:aldo/keto reductase [Janibacter sp. GXQ6167]|uniref:aldo/keto reductase n=1 Tax=Janibacter sp. GXQ6167 TaxID=3240791 RepID=UPI003525FF38